MTRPGIEPRSSGSLTNTQPIENQVDMNCQWPGSITGRIKLCVKCTCIDNHITISILKICKKGIVTGQEWKHIISQFHFLSLSFFFFLRYIVNMIELPLIHTYWHWKIVNTNSYLLGEKPYKYQNISRRHVMSLSRHFGSTTWKTTLISSKTQVSNSLSRRNETKREMIAKN